MKLDVNSTTPIYIQVAEMIETMILDGSLNEGDQIPSTNQLAAMYTLNPATVRKGFNLLTDQGIIYKKRGLGMFVKEGSKEQIKEQRKEQFYQDYILKMLSESVKLGINKTQIIEMIQNSEVN
ncbi:GntR family transcriptional regulator [Vallitalea okinawensis]|uniref:GntR family transcriptional regulator n=1 Tax=Vallitalea okinawensis TaxID=2078660 RepID=UPI000CFC1C9B|nr:GntR family transcriptional regulator [Vallitalea okinawensis]